MHGTDYDSLPNEALIYRGQQNARACQEAIRVLRVRGHWPAVQFLEHRLQMFKNAGDSGRWFWRNAEPLKRGGWIIDPRQKARVAARKVAPKPKPQETIA